MTKAELETLLGPPDFSRLDFGPKGPGEKWLGSSWTYYLAKRDSSANEYDPRIQVYFDREDRAHWIAVTNVPGAKSLGGGHVKCT